MDFWTATTGEAFSRHNILILQERWDKVVTGAEQNQEYYIKSRVFFKNAQFLLKDIKDLS